MLTHFFGFHTLTLSPKFLTYHFCFCWRRSSTTSLLFLVNFQLFSPEKDLGFLLNLFFPSSVLISKCIPTLLYENWTMKSLVTVAKKHHFGEQSSRARSSLQISKFSLSNWTMFFELGSFDMYRLMQLVHMLNVVEAKCKNGLNGAYFMALQSMARSRREMSEEKRSTGVSGCSICVKKTKARRDVHRGALEQVHCICATFSSLLSSLSISTYFESGSCFHMALLLQTCK